MGTEGWRRGLIGYNPGFGETNGENALATLELSHAPVFIGEFDQLYDITLLVSGLKKGQLQVQANYWAFRTLQILACFFNPNLDKAEIVLSLSDKILDGPYPSSPLHQVHITICVCAEQRDLARAIFIRKNVFIIESRKRY